jgi:hypothetical protein
MSTYSTLIEAWGCDSFKNKKRKKKKRRPKREQYQDYKEISQGTEILNEKGQNIYKPSYKRTKRRNRAQYDSNPSMNINRMKQSSRSVDPIRIKLEEEEADYEGYNSSDYDQYELEDDRDLTITSQKEYNGERNAWGTRDTRDTSVMQDDYEPEETPYEECNENRQYERVEQEQVDQVQQDQQYYQLDSNAISRLYNILDKLESDTGGGENMYDVLLFIFFGVFILFIIDYMYKIGVKTSSNL